MGVAPVGAGEESPQTEGPAAPKPNTMEQRIKNKESIRLISCILLLSADIHQ